MSFLRVGGFILVHAGMMAVVFTLAGMVGGGALPVVIIIGNAFVMLLEGLIVGIQVLRLEFYEIFSRFFDATGEPFKPVTVNDIK
jgi:V/A-type H+-transporting ATPase subunit I